MIRIVVLLAGSLLSSNLFASAVEIRGSRTCAKWIEEKSMANSTHEMNRIPILITKSWFLGYLSGRADESGKNILQGTDSESLFLWLDNYCRANPKQTLESGGTALARELMQMKGIKP